jgi:glycosyltransferase involved in cell wall biosynthesis
MSTQHSVSVVIPAKNEGASIGGLAARVRQVLPDAEVIVVDDGSSDNTGAAAAAAGARVVRHPQSRGNGAAVKTGARHARGTRLVFMDGDGQHDPADVPRLLAHLDRGYDMAVGARSHGMHAGPFRLLANRFYNLLASWMSGVPIPDLTSGFRAADAARFRQFLPLLPNGFSYPTTSTMAFLRAGYPVVFEPVQVQQRKQGTQSHIRPMRDGARFLLIIFKVATLYSPLKIFLPLSLFFFSSGVAYYAYTFIASGRFTNFGGLLFTTSVLVFLIGLVSEQITTLIYLSADRSDRSDRSI